MLTGDFKVLKTDIVMDVGKSLNPAVDVGQIEGAFVQGMGLFTMEEMVYLNESRNTQKGKKVQYTSNLFNFNVTTAINNPQIYQKKPTSLNDILSHCVVINEKLHFVVELRQ